jgi:hypothetical protein
VITDLVVTGLFVSGGAFGESRSEVIRRAGDGEQETESAHLCRPPPCGGQIRAADQGVGLGLGGFGSRAVTESATDPSVAFGDSSPQGGERLGLGRV